MANFTLLEKEQVESLSMFKSRGAKAPFTDYAILSYNNYNGNFNVKYAPAGGYWTNTTDFNSFDLDQYYVVDENGNAKESSEDCCSQFGIRPAVRLLEIMDKATRIEKKEDGVLELEYGLFPRNMPSLSEQNELLKLYSANKLDKLFDSEIGPKESFYDYKSAYRYNGKIYVLTSDRYGLASQKYKVEYLPENIFIEVEPLKWWADEENDIAVTSEILFAGATYWMSQDYLNVFSNNILRFDGYRTRDRNNTSSKKINFDKIVLKSFFGTNSKNEIELKKDSFYNIITDSYKEEERKNNFLKNPAIILATKIKDSGVPSDSVSAVFLRPKINDSFFFENYDLIKKFELISFLDLSGMECSKYNLEGMDLSNSGIKLNLEEYRKTGYTLNNTNLENVFLFRQELKDISANGANLKGTYIAITPSVNQIDGTLFDETCCFFREDGISIPYDDLRAIGVNIEPRDISIKLKI